MHRFLPALFLLIVQSCSRTNFVARTPLPSRQVSAGATENLHSNCAGSFSPDIDYFSHKAEVRFAKQFSVSYHGHYKRLIFDPVTSTKIREEYLLVQCGTPVPPHDSSVRVITVPAQRFSTGSLAFISSIVRMNLTESLVGVSSIRGVSHADVIARYEKGLVKEVGVGPHSSVEIALAADLDLLFTFYSAWPNYNVHPKLWEAGVKSIPLADHFEQDPLGRTEWIKFLALFFNREAEANRIFEPAAERYLELKKLAADARNRPRVMVGWPGDRDTWYLNGAHNFFANMIRDAGGEYFWRDDLSYSMIPVALERVYDEQAPARFWIARSFAAHSRVAMAKTNPALTSFSSYKSQAIWMPDRNTSVHRRPPYQDQSLDKPDVLLADMIYMLHTELMPKYEPSYLRQLD